MPFHVKTRQQTSLKLPHYQISILLLLLLFCSQLPQTVGHSEIKVGLVVHIQVIDLE